MSDPPTRETETPPLTRRQVRLKRMRGIGVRVFVFGMSMAIAAAVLFQAGPVEWEKIAGGMHGLGITVMLVGATVFLAGSVLERHHLGEAVEERLGLLRDRATKGGFGWFHISPTWYLVLDKPTVTDEHVRRLAGRTQLRVLSLAGTQVTDAGIAHLVDLYRLDHLNLRNTNITDAALVHLVELTNLRRLLLEGTAVTAAGVAQLQQALPRCTIRYETDPGDPEGEQA